MDELRTGKTMKSKFDFYEVVKIVSDRSILSDINGLEAVVMGMVKNDNGEWCYAIQLLKSEEGWDAMESDLIPTGILMSRENFYDQEIIAVEVNTSTGEGKKAS